MKENTLKIFLLFQTIILNFLLFFIGNEIKLSNELTTHLCEEILDLKERSNDANVVTPSTLNSEETHSKGAKTAGGCLLACCIVGGVVLSYSIFGPLFQTDATHIQNILDSNSAFERIKIKNIHELINHVGNDIKNDNSNRHAQIWEALKVIVDLMPKI